MLLLFLLLFCFQTMPMSPSRLTVIEIIITVFVNILLGTLWFRLFFGTDLVTAFSVRAIKGVLTLPITVAVNFALYKSLSKIPEVKRILKEQQ